MTDLEQLRDDILNEMYAEAEPPLDFDYALENPDEMDDDWYSQHYLSDERQREIFDKHTAKHDLTDSEHTSLTMTCILSLGPSNVKEEDKEI